MEFREGAFDFQTSQQNRSEHNLPSMKVINSVLRSHTGLVRLYFDAVYQERKYGSKIDEETGEIL
ncbi:hypothetical protein EFL48_12005 [Lactococcus cremoris]|nr:hypothetical protein [Lactococcus cremoris]